MLSYMVTFLWATLARCCTQCSHALVPYAYAFIALRTIAPMHLRDTTCATMHAIARVFKHSLCLCHSIYLFSCSSSRVRLALLSCLQKHPHVAAKTWHKAPNQAKVVGHHNSWWWETSPTKKAQLRHYLANYLRNWATISCVVKPYGHLPLSHARCCTQCLYALVPHAWAFITPCAACPFRLHTYEMLCALQCMLLHALSCSPCAYAIAYACCRAPAHVSNMPCFRACRLNSIINYYQCQSASIHNK